MEQNATAQNDKLVMLKTHHQFGSGLESSAWQARASDGIALFVVPIA
ncbi:hypothetical protein KUL72_29240 [Bradyrhizobium arachidis]|nr:hypothetical protein [Bradyrhizobium arachidis]UVO35495.1 hypothetical protein KUL72_29240 [Bradyrhizobium arachidis]